MAEKQSSEGAVKQLLEGQLDPNTRRAREISDAVAERVLKYSGEGEAKQSDGLLSS